VLALAGGASLALLLVLFAFRPLPTKKGGTTMSNFIRRRSDGPAGEKPRDLGAAPSRVDEAVTSYTMRGDDHAAKEPGEEDDAIAARGIVSYDELGQTIANVLRSAQDNAAQITATARAQAQSIQEAAEAQAKEARVQLETEMAERRAESERIRADANRYAEERRRDADIEANQLRVDAEAEARKLRNAGEAARRTLEAKGLARRQELMEASSSMEARLHDALETCRAVTGQIEELLGKEPKLDEELLNEVRGAEEEVEREEEQVEAAQKAS
jgi:FtsZ-binding cell division protein ZapB